MTEQSVNGRSAANPGAVLKSLRLQRGWTLAEVSRRTGFPISTLSKIENDKMSLSYDKLVRISRGLDIDISRLFGTPAGLGDSPSGIVGRRSITRAGEGKSIETASYGHLYPASDLLNKQIIPIIAEVRARSLEEFGELVRHPGEEFAYVIEGEIDLYTGLYAPVRLKAGDSIYFDSSMGHAYIAASEPPCRVLSICSASESEVLEAMTDGRQRTDSRARAQLSTRKHDAGAIKPPPQQRSRNRK